MGGANSVVSGPPWLGEVLHRDYPLGFFGLKAKIGQDYAADGDEDKAMRFVRSMIRFVDQ